MSKLVFAVESISNIIHELEDIIPDHWEEVALDRSSTPLSPDWDVYRAIDAAGGFHTVTARDSGKLVGYSIYVVSKNLHYASVYQAETDVFYLAPSYRKGLAGVRLLKFSEKTLKEKGVNKVISKAKLHNQVGKLLEMIGYNPIETVYAKKL